METSWNDFVNEIYRVLATEEADIGIHKVFEMVGTRLGITGVFLMHSGDIPLLLEMKDLWEAEPAIGDRRPILDYNTDKYEWAEMNPFNDKSSFIAVEDISKVRLGKATAEFADDLGIRSFVISGMVRNSDFLGSIVFYCASPHKWSEEEKTVMKQTTELLYTTVLRRWKEDSQRYLFDEANKLVQNAFESKSQFLSDVSHAVRTPINALIGMVSIMRHNLENPEVVEQCLDRMEKSSRQLMDLINGCVDSNLIGSEELMLNKSWTSLEDLCNDVRRMTLHLADVKKQKVEFDYDPVIRINIDRSKVGRIITNLVTNSCKYSPEGSNIFVSIKPEHTGSQKTQFNFRVKDDGMGMPEEVSRHVFDPVADISTPARASGTGLGLMITKHLIDMMHGTIELSTGKGHGTEIVVGLQLETDADFSAGRVSEEAQGPDENAEMYIGRRILIAEDNVLMAEILATILGYRGLETDTAINGREALDMYLAQDAFYYDMIFMDIQMPVMDGIKSAMGIRSAGKADSAIIPIIALSSNTFEEDAKQSLDAGMNAHLGKPVAEKELFETISRFML